jgi:hypothetical protein
MFSRTAVWQLIFITHVQQAKQSNPYPHQGTKTQGMELEAGCVPEPGSTLTSAGNRTAAAQYVAHRYTGQDIPISVYYIGTIQEFIQFECYNL